MSFNMNLIFFVERAEDNLEKHESEYLHKQAYIL
jgi:hypothetical protein